MILNNGAGGMVEIVDGNGVVIGRGELEDEARWQAERVLRERGVANAAEVAAALPVKGAELTADDLSDLRACERGAHGGRDGRRNLRTSELEDYGARLTALGLVRVRAGHVELTEAGWAELEARDAASAA